MSDSNFETEGEVESPSTILSANTTIEPEMGNQEFFMFAYTTLRELMKDIYALQAREDFVMKDKEKIHAEIKEANNFNEEKPEYRKYLENLQKALYEQNINVFNQLLTYFIRDVLKTDKAIEMKLFTSRGMPGISVEAVNNGFNENIIDGSGGAIANIVSTGLRLICLSRLAHRKFIILDEPDCWIKPEFVPSFAKIIGELSRKLRIQTIIISHHSWEYFKDYGRVIELDKDGSILENRIKHDTDFDIPKDMDYLKEVTFKRFMSHFNTTYQLHPFLTCIIGKNDLGKSVIAAAMKALAFNSASDSCVMHNENSAQVFARSSLGDGFLWERFKVKEKGQEQKVKYSLFKDDDLIASEFNSDYVPSFINDKLRIMKSEEIDVHISSQKTPIFMIGNDVSPANKAKILSLGKEIIVIQQMMSYIQSKSTEYNAKNRKNEPLYEQYVRELKLLSGVENFIPTFDELQKKIESLKNEISKLEKLEMFLPEFQQLQKLKEIESIKDSIKIPQFKDEDNINNLLVELKTGADYSNISKIDSLPALPKLKDETKIKQLVHLLGSLGKSQNIKQVSKLDIPQFQDEDAINELVYILDQHHQYQKIEKISSLPVLELQDEDKINDILFILDEERKTIEIIQEQILKHQEKMKSIELKKKALEQKIHDEYEKSGNVCPTCKQQVSFELYKEHLL